MKKLDEYGLLIEPVNRYGTEYVEVRVVRREDGREGPLGCSGDGEAFYGYGCPKHLVGLSLDGLGMYGFVSEGKDPAFIAADVEFHNIYGAHATRLKRMLKAINRVTARIRKDNAGRDPGDKFMSFAAALKLSFAVVRNTPGRDSDWTFMSITEGRNRYRDLIDKALAKAKEKL